MKPNEMQPASPWRATVIIIIAGFSMLIAQHLSPPLIDGPILVIVPPWREGGLTFAADVGLPIIDIRFGGRLLIFAEPDVPMSQSRLGPFVMPAASPFGCAAVVPTSGVFSS
jgi:hypothetical protein